MAAKQQKIAYLRNRKEFVAEEVIPTCADYYFDWLLCDAVAHLNATSRNMQLKRSVSMSRHSLDSNPMP